MSGDLEKSLRSLIRSVVQEVLDENDFWKSGRGESGKSSAGEMEQEKLLKSSEVAELLSISERKLFTITKTGSLPSVRMGHQVRYRKETVLDWIRNSETPNRSEEAATRIVGPAVQTKVAKKQRKRKDPNASGRKGRAAKKRSTRKAITDEADEIQSIVVTTRRKEVITENKWQSPFDVFLESEGVDLDLLPPLTNGELMKISQTDIVEYSNWMYHGGKLSEEALERLRTHFVENRL